ncbi:MAG TPA: hypothetical protein ENJ18_17140 [Nannocystis exedens]|nr:hypothetical protein [Nannocystis exedens]
MQSSGYHGAVSEPRSGEAPPRLCDFPPVGRDAWELRALRELAGAPLETLRRQTRHGVSHGPLYCDGDGGSPSHQAALARAPGEAPFLRGPKPPGEVRGWQIRQTIDTPDPALANADARADLGRGVDSLWIRLCHSDQRTSARPGVRVRDLADLTRLLEGIDLYSHNLVIETGNYSRAMAAALLVLARRRGTDPASLRLTLGTDPLAELALRGRLGGGLNYAYRDLAKTLDELSTVAPKVRCVLCTAIPYADAGAGADEQLALLLCTLIEHLRQLRAQGIGVAAIAPRLLGALSVDRDLFISIAKVRAARLLVARVLIACGLDPAAAALPIHLEGSWRELSAFDPWVNLLRGTTDAFVGAVTGVESIAVAPFTDALGRADGDARRIASNTQLLLREECRLGHVVDPTGGSWYIEALTDSLARAAWTRVQAIEAKGGLAKALLCGSVQADLASAELRSEAAVSRAKTVITGVNRYAIPDESSPDYFSMSEETCFSSERSGDVASSPGGATVADTFVAIASALEAGLSFEELLGRSEEPEEPEESVVRALVRRRLAEPFEELRSGPKTAAGLLCIGELSAIKPRIDFMWALLASGGIRATGRAKLWAAEEYVASVKAFAEAGHRAAVIIAADDAYADLLPAIVPLLRAAGASVIAIAGGPPELSTDDALRDAGVDLSLRRGGDALAGLRLLRGAAFC